MSRQNMRRNMVGVSRRIRMIDFPYMVKRVAKSGAFEHIEWDGYNWAIPEEWMTDKWVAVYPQPGVANPFEVSYRLTDIWAD